VTLIPSSSASTRIFTPEELAHLRELRRAFLRQQGIIPRDDKNETD
jgi:hypothetical protein